MNGAHHGGNLSAAAARWGIPETDWLDLSTGLNPWPWPVPQPLPASLFQRLPYPSSALERAAQDCYDAPHALAVAGSQPAIQALPRLRSPGRVALPDIGYAEHADAWQKAGHTLVRYPNGADLPRWLASNPVDVMAVINPNNPTASLHSPDALLDCHLQLAKRGGWLVVDEAFADPLPALSLAPFSDRPGLIVLRSLGKFFGLAGLRLGFVLAPPELLRALEEYLGPWTITGPSQWLGVQALRDHAWQAATRQRLVEASSRQRNWLVEHLAPEHIASSALFSTLSVGAGRAQQVHEALARRGILTRLFPEHDLLRFGLWDESGQGRLLAALEGIRR